MEVEPPSAVSIESTKDCDAELLCAGLGRILNFLQTRNVEDMNEHACKELQVLWDDLEKFKLYLTWLEPHVQYALGMQSFVEKGREVENINDKLVVLELETMRLKEKLVSAEISFDVERESLKAKGTLRRYRISVLFAMTTIPISSLESNQDDEPTLNITQNIHISEAVETNQDVLYSDEEIKPKIGEIFDSLEDGELFYKKYAHSVGFSVRCSSENKNKDGVIRWKYFVCSKEGYKPDVSKEKEVCELGVKVKRRSITREGCDAKVAFKLVEGGKYELTRFQESHTHALASPKKRQFLRSARKVNNIHKSIMFANSRANVGPSKTYHLLKEQVGGYENIGCTQRDLQNSFRDLKTLIKDSDAYVFIDNFKRKQKANPSFYFAYEVDVEDRLKHVFWADGICRKNYFLFGDVMSFDTTYETNKYSMIFAPFTGVNHHRQSVTFGAAFLANEKAHSFIWLFEKFLEAMRGNKPNLIITDQDPAMKIAIEKVFDSSAHRFCMWHIMKKVSEKVGVSLNSNDEFNNKFKSCVWGSDTFEKFEASWKSIIVEFGLQKNEWLSHMYNIRNMWIPTYFKDIFLAGILRTTSRSESENSFYGNFLNPTVGLVEFWMRFESAIEAQRHKELLADNTSLHSLPELKLNRGLEIHGRDIYTRENFYIFQNELWIGCVDCGVENINQKDGVDVLRIVDNSETNGRVSEVVYNVSDYSSTCSCNMFQSQGIPCRHILCVLRGKGLTEIPSKYVLNRWTKMATNKSVFNVDGKDLEGFSEPKNERQLISEAWNHLYTCMHMAGQCKEKLLLIINGSVNIKKQLSEFEDDSLPTKTKELECLIGFDLSKEVKIHPPQPSKTKGSGKRIKGGKEKAIEQQNKKSRLCKACGQYAYHDTRNCPGKSSS